MENDNDGDGLAIKIIPRVITHRIIRNDRVILNSRGIFLHVRKVASMMHATCSHASNLQLTCQGHGAHKLNEHDTLRAIFPPVILHFFFSFEHFLSFRR